MPGYGKVRVAVKQTPPFAIRSEEGNWRGISIDLWREVARELNIQYELEEMSLQEMLDGLEDGTVDVAVAALTVTAEREESMDFTHPIHSSGLGMAVVSKEQSGVTAVMNQLFSWAVLQIILGIVITLLVLGALIYLLERKKNKEQFERGFFRGIISGIWWAGVTMTTVGYGDKVPKTVPGRILGLVWMFAGIILIALFTAVVSSALTVNRLQSTLKGPEDLPNSRIACVEASTGSEYLARHHLICRRYPSASKAMEALARGERDVVVYDAPILKYLARQDYQGNVLVLPQTFERQDYAFGLPNGSALREPCNRALLRLISNPKWQERLKEYLGE